MMLRFMILTIGGATCLMKLQRTLATLLHAPSIGQKWELSENKERGR